MSEATPTQQLATILLGQPVREWIVAKRAMGMPWRSIANHLNDETNGRVIVSHETVRSWAEEVAAA
jgi:hypothetical protein